MNFNIKTDHAVLVNAEGTAIGGVYLCICMYVHNNQLRFMALHYNI